MTSLVIETYPFADYSKVDGALNFISLSVCLPEFPNSKRSVTLANIVCFHQVTIHLIG